MVELGACTMVLSRHLRFGRKITDIGNMLGIWRLCPSGSRGRTPGQEVWEEIIQKHNKKASIR